MVIPNSHRPTRRNKPSCLVVVAECEQISAIVQSTPPTPTRRDKTVLSSLFGRCGRGISVGRYSTVITVIRLGVRVYGSVRVMIRSGGRCPGASILSIRVPWGRVTGDRGG